MCEFNTKIAITQLLRLTIVSAKSKIYCPRRSYLSPGNSIILDIGATLLFISATIFCWFWGSFCWNSSTPPTDLFFFFVSYARAAYSALPQKSSRVTFQPTYANLLSSKMTQHVKFTEAGNLTKIFRAKNLLKQTTYLLLQAKNPSYFNCVRANKTHNPCRKAYAIK